MEHRNSGNSINMTGKQKVNKEKVIPYDKLQIKNVNQSSGDTEAKRTADAADS